MNLRRLFLKKKLPQLTACGRIFLKPAETDFGDQFFEGLPPSLNSTNLSWLQCFLVFYISFCDMRLGYWILWSFWVIVAFYSIVPALDFFWHSLRYWTHCFGSSLLFTA